MAIGDSSASGPGIGDEDPSSPECFRSERNYPALVAEELKDKTFTDVTCGSATTESVRQGDETANGAAIAPQVTALGSDTELVTVSIGANDEGASGVLYTCLFSDGDDDRECQDLVAKRTPTVFSKIRKNVVELLDEIQAEAPDARVILVGYLHIVPRTGDCEDLRMSDAARNAAQKWEARTNVALKEAAEEAGTEFVDLRSVSRGHDACAGEARWVNGTEDVADDGAFLHPNAAGMAAVAAEVVKVLQKS